MSSERKQKLLLYAVLMVVLIAGSLFMNHRFVQIDNCLDAGNAWDYDSNICSTDCVEKGGVFDRDAGLCRPAKG
jgi:hypothetical protein